MRSCVGDRTEHPQLQQMQMATAGAMGNCLETSSCSVHIHALLSAALSIIAATFRSFLYSRFRYINCKTCQLGIRAEHSRLQPRLTACLVSHPCAVCKPLPTCSRFVVSAVLQRPVRHRHERSCSQAAAAPDTQPSLRIRSTVSAACRRSMSSVVQRPLHGPAQRTATCKPRKQCSIGRCTAWQATACSNGNARDIACHPVLRSLGRSARLHNAVHALHARHEQFVGCAVTKLAIVI